MLKAQVSCTEILKFPITAEDRKFSFHTETSTPYMLSPLAKNRLQTNQVLECQINLSAGFRWILFVHSCINLNVTNYSIVLHYFKKNLPLTKLLLQKCRIITIS